jgi:hypothetical protein
MSSVSERGIQVPEREFAEKAGRFNKSGIPQAIFAVAGHNPNLRPLIQSDPRKLLSREITTSEDPIGVLICKEWDGGKGDEVEDHRTGVINTTAQRGWKQLSAWVEKDPETARDVLCLLREDKFIKEDFDMATGSVVDKHQFSLGRKLHRSELPEDPNKAGIDTRIVIEFFSSPLLEAVRNS